MHSFILNEINKQLLKSSHIFMSLGCNKKSLGELYIRRVEKLMNFNLLFCSSQRSWESMDDVLLNPSMHIQKDQDNFMRGLRSSYLLSTHLSRQWGWSFISIRRESSYNLKLGPLFLAKIFLNWINFFLYYVYMIS